MSESNIVNVVNGVNIPVTYENGKAGLVVLKKLSIEKLYKFVELLTGEKSPQLVALCADQNMDWINLLSDASYGELLKHCIKANFHRAMKLVESDPVMAVRLLPLLQGMEKLSKIASSKPEASGSNTTDLSRGPALAESVEASGTAS